MNDQDRPAATADTWKPDGWHRSFAAEHGLDLDHYVGKFLDFTDAEPTNLGGAFTRYLQRVVRDRNGRHFDTNAQPTEPVGTKPCPCCAGATNGETFDLCATCGDAYVDNQVLPHACTGWGQRAKEPVAAS